MPTVPHINYRTYLRSIIAIAMMAVWSLVVLSGFLLWLAPHGPRSGHRALVFDLTKQEWGELHLYFSLAAIALTIAHLIIDWRGLCGCVKYLAGVHRQGNPANREASRHSPARVEPVGANASGGSGRTGVAG